MNGSEWVIYSVVIGIIVGPIVLGIIHLLGRAQDEMRFQDAHQQVMDKIEREKAEAQDKV